MNHVAVHIIQKGGRKNTLLVGAGVTWKQLRAVFNQVEELSLIEPGTSEPSEEATLAELAEQGTIIHSGLIHLEFRVATPELVAMIALEERPPEPSSYAITAMKDFSFPKDFIPQELPDHQPRFTSRDFRRQAKNRPPKTR